MECLCFKLSNFFGVVKRLVVCFFSVCEVEFVEMMGDLEMFDLIEL